MVFSIKPKRVVGLFLFCALFLSASVFAANPLITRHFSGVWDQPEQESQGIILQIGEQGDDEKVGIAYWFTYGEDLQTTWYVGVGPVNGNEINMVLYSAFNIGFMEDSLVGDANVVPIGELDLVFKNCNHGIATYRTELDGVESGEFPIKRINSIYRTRCSGDKSDDMERTKIEVDLESTDVIEGAKGEAEYEIDDDETEFSVKIKNVVAGSFKVIVGGVEVGVIEVVEDDGDFEGKIKFNDPDFDVFDKLIEILNGDDVVILFAQFPEM